MPRADRRASWDWLRAALFACALAGVPRAHAAEMLRARVLLDDLIPPASPVAVQLLCDERVVAETAADERGRFALPAPSGDRAGCRLTAAAAGYEPDAVSLARLPLDPDIGALVLRRAGRWNGYAQSAGSLAANAEARDAFELAVGAMRQGGQEGLARAEAAFAQATEADPELAPAWHQLGRLRLARQDVDGGRTALRRAIEADPWYVSPYRPLLLLELGEEHWPQVAELSARLLELDPYLADIRYYRGLALVEMGEAEAARTEVEAIAGGAEGATFALLDHLRGLVLEGLGQAAAARAAYRRYLEADPEGGAAAEVRARLAAMEAQ